MWELARRNLLRERTRLGISIAGVALSVLLMLSLAGVYNAYQQRIAGYFGGIDADLWVVQSGTSNFFHSSSVLPSSAQPAISEVDGVADVRPYVGRQVGFQAEGRELVTYVVGVPEGEEVGGPVAVVEGVATVRDGEIVIDRVMADAAGLSLGEAISLRGRSFRVSGVTRGGDMVMYQYSFVSMGEVLALQGNRSIVNFFLVDLEAGADARAVAVEIEGAVPGIEAWTPTKVIEENQGVIEDAFLPVVGVLLLIGFVVGTAVIGLTTYSMVLERRREYGVLKALGADFGATLRVVLAQSGIAGFAGYLIGVGASLAVARWIPRVVPQFAVDLEPGHVLWVLAATTGMILTSAAFPLRRVSSIDPAEVFRA